MTTPPFIFRSAGMTHPGTVRERNEDAWIERPVLGLWAIADGLGGHASGDQASRLLVDRLGQIETVDARALLTAVQTHMSKANQDLLRVAADSGNTVASTIVVLLAAAGHYACLWAGDSRAYLLRENRLQRITKDHSLVQEMVDRGLITEAETETHAQRHILTRAVGGEDVLVLDKITAPVQLGDRFLLCSDGLTRAVAEDEIAAALALAIEEVPSRLVALALMRQCSDNVTVIAIEAEAG